MDDEMNANDKSKFDDEMFEMDEEADPEKDVKSKSIPQPKVAEKKTTKTSNIAIKQVTEMF